MTRAPFAYDVVGYDTEANADTHPVALATLARLAGLSPAPAAHARVLEIGCGDGENLSAAATYLPNATFVGFDLAADAIAAGKAVAGPNVTLSVEDILSVRGLGELDYVIAHGIYSWVPAAVRSALLALMRDSLGPNGVGFLSVNARPGWKYRGSLRSLALDRGRGLTDPGERVRAALTVVDEIARGGKDAPGYLGRLAKHAAEYLAHVERATPPDAPFSRYVFHDLLAYCNDAFSVESLASDLSKAGLSIVCETPLRSRSLAELPERMRTSELPFLQVLVRRQIAGEDHLPSTIDPERVLDLFVWADFTPVDGGGYRTTTGALVRPPAGSPLDRLAKLTPRFVRVRDVDRDPRFAAQLFEGFCDGVITLRSEPPTLGPSIADHVRERAARALARGAASETLTNALHRSFRLSATELARLDDPRLERLLFRGPA